MSEQWIKWVNRQMGVSLDMLQVAIDTATEDVWDNHHDEPRFWRVCTHIVFYIDFYLSTFQPDTENIPDTYILPDFLHKYTKSWIADVEEPTVTKYDLIQYLDYSRKRFGDSFASNIGDQVSEPSGFEWLPMTKGELLLYNMRHIMEHTAILNQILKKHGLPASGWKGIGEI